MAAKMELNEASPAFNEEDPRWDSEEHGFSGVACFLGSICFPYSLFSCYTLEEKQEAILLSFGKYNGTVRDPGCHWANNCGREIRKISTKHISVDLQTAKIIDGNGNPLLVSGVLTYTFVHPKRAALGVENAAQFIHAQSTAVLKQVVSRYPYESVDGSPCLKSEAREITNELVTLLQEKVRPAGAQILSFEFNELSYAPEIAAGMLKRQQAHAMVEARTTIVKGAVDIAFSAMTELEQRGVKMNDADKARLLSNLLTVICGEHDAQPTINLGAH